MSDPQTNTPTDPDPTDGSRDAVDGALLREEVAQREERHAVQAEVPPSEIEPEASPFVPPDDGAGAAQPG
jgi:hypothetical protein